MMGHSVVCSPAWRVQKAALRFLLPTQIVKSTLWIHMAIFFETGLFFRQSPQRGHFRTPYLQHPADALEAEPPPPH